MKQIYPSYYTAFRCIGGACGDNCCIGWEIEIDARTLAAYRVLPGSTPRGWKILSGEPGRAGAGAVDRRAL